MAVGHQQLSENGGQTPQQLTPRMSPHTPTESSAGLSIARATLAMLLTVVIAASSIVMVGPQIIVIVPVALGAGLVFALRRSFWSLVCFGYPFTFGLISAWAGYKEMPGYERSTAFVVSIGIGLVGCVLIAVGLWKALPGKSSISSSSMMGLLPIVSHPPAHLLYSEIKSIRPLVLSVTKRPFRQQGFLYYLDGGRVRSALMCRQMSAVTP